MPQPWQHLSFKNKHPRDDNLVFHEPTHTYYIDGSSKGVISCTKFLHEFFPHFDPDATIQKMMKSKNWSSSVWNTPGVTPAKIKKAWDDKGKEASTAGTAMHLAIEQFLHGAEEEIDPKTYETVEWKYFMNFWNVVKDDLVPYRSEWEVWMDEFKLCGSIDMIDKVYNEFNFNGVSNHISSWVRTPANLNDLLFYHGEKRINIMNEMIDKIKSYNNKPNKLKILFLAPHLSTGGMPSFLLKRIQSLQKYSDLVELFVVEYSNHSDYYVVQKNMIKEIIPTSNFWTLGKDKTELLRIIKNNNIDIVHIDDVIEELDIYNPIPKELIEGLYSKDRSWRIVETCHNVSFRADLSKVLHPEAYAYCTPYHEKITFKDLPSYGETILFPIENNPITDEEKIKSKEKLGFDLNKIHVVNVGLWTKGKNQGEGVELAKSLVKSNPEIHFHFVGNQAPNFEEYWLPIMKSIPNNVTVWGERADANTFMMAADIFMFNSTWECNPLVLREASSYGLKILSRNLPQYMDMFTPYITEIDNNINSTKAKLLSLINNKIKYKIPQGQFDNFGEQYFNFYNKVKNIEIKKQNISNINIQVIQHFVNQPYFEIKGSSDKVYNVKFFDEKNYCHYENKLPINHWIKLNRQYFTKWRTEVWMKMN